jgi:hypothetical protein
MGLTFLVEVLELFLNIRLLVFSDMAI